MVSSDPYMQDGLELVKIAVVGQSFVLHQIRKMVGFAMSVVRGYATEGMMDAAFERGKVFVPRAPGLGLMLDQVYFDVYNKKFGKSPDHTEIDFKEFDEKIE